VILGDSAGAASGFPSGRFLNSGSRASFWMEERLRSAGSGYQGVFGVRLCYQEPDDLFLICSATETSSESVCQCMIYKVALKHTETASGKPRRRL